MNIKPAVEIELDDISIIPTELCNEVYEHAKYIDENDLHQYMKIFISAGKVDIIKILQS